MNTNSEMIPEENIAAHSIVKSDINTGLIVGGSYKSSSGFEYINGMRKFGDLTIIESVGAGIGVTYLNSVRVLDKENKVIIDKVAGKGTFYSREAVRRIVKDELLKMLSNAADTNGREFDQGHAESIINKNLEDAYYRQSYKSVLEWAKSIGIQLNEKAI